MMTEKKFRNKLSVLFKTDEFINGSKRNLSYLQHKDAISHMMGSIFSGRVHDVDNSVLNSIFSFTLFGTKMFFTIGIIGTTFYIDLYLHSQIMLATWIGKIDDMDKSLISEIIFIEEGRFPEKNLITDDEVYTLLKSAGVAI